MTPHDPSDRLDAHARALHAESLDRLSPRVRAQLAQRRRAVLQPVRPVASRPAWRWAGAATAACVLLLAIQLRPADAPLDADRSASAVVSADTVEPRPADPTAALAEDPDFYLWLASSEGRTLAME